MGTTNREFLEYAQSPEEIYKANGKALWSLAGDANYACMCRAILSTGDMQPLGYLVIICQNEYFSSELTTVSSSYASKVYLVDKDNCVVAANSSETVGQKFSYSLEALKTAEPIQSMIQARGKAAITIQANHFKTAGHWSTVSTKQFRKGIMASVLQMGLVIGLALILALFITMVAVRKLIGPAKLLLNSMSAFGNGNLDSRVKFSGNDEIGQIGVHIIRWLTIYRI